MGQGLSKLEKRGVVLVGPNRSSPLRSSGRNSENWENESNVYPESEIEAAYFFENFISYRVTNMFPSYLNEFQRLYKVNLNQAGCTKFDASDLTDSDEDKVKEYLIFRSKDNNNNNTNINEKLGEICKVLRSLRRDPDVLDENALPNNGKLNDEPMPSASSFSNDTMAQNSTEDIMMEVDGIDSDLYAFTTRKSLIKKNLFTSNNENEEQPTLPPKHFKRNLPENGETIYRFTRSILNRKFVKFEILDTVVAEAQEKSSALNAKWKFENRNKVFLHRKKSGLKRPVISKNLSDSSHDQEKKLSDFTSSISISSTKQEFSSGAESTANFSDDKHQNFVRRVQEDFNPFLSLDDNEDADKIQNQEVSSSSNNSKVGGISGLTLDRVLNKFSEEECNVFVSSDDDEDRIKNNKVARERESNSSTDDSNGSSSKNMIRYLLSLTNNEDADDRLSIEEFQGNPNLNNSDRYSVFITLNFVKFIIKTMPVFFFEVFNDELLEEKLKLYKSPHICRELSTTYIYVVRINENVDFFNYQLSLTVLVVQSIALLEIPPTDDMLVLAHRLDAIYNFTNELNLQIMNINKKLMKQFNVTKNLFHLFVLNVTSRYLKNIIELPEEIIRKCLTFSPLITKFNELFNTLNTVSREINDYNNIFDKME